MKIKQLLLALPLVVVSYGANAQSAAVIGTCGSITYDAGGQRIVTQDTTGKLCVNATVSATATIAAFAPVGTNNAIAVTSTTARTALTGAAANSTTLVENSGATDVFVAFGDNTITVTAANGTRVPAGWAIAFNIGAATNIAYITASSTSTINATTGTGLPALGAAGSGGGGGGAITAASSSYAAGALSAGAGVDGWDLTQGAKADAVCGTATGTCSMVALQKFIANAVNSAIPDCGATPCTNKIGNVYLQSQYPAGAIPITASATGTTAATTATLAGTGSKTTFICGYSIRANATAATTVTNTITGTITATLSSIMWVAPAASGIGVDEMVFSPCIPASATNTGIAIVSGAPGTGGNVSSKGWGYQL